MTVLAYSMCVLKETFVYTIIICFIAYRKLAIALICLIVSKRVALLVSSVQTSKPVE